MAADRGNRKVKTGVVISASMNKTAVVEVERTIRHAHFHKVVSRKKKYYAHDESDAVQVGDTVTIVETRPLSKTNRWRIQAGGE